MITADDGPLLIAFVAVVRGGSFVSAAKELRLSKSVVSERVKKLEERCGARLLERTTRRLRVTEAGAEVLDAATRVEDALGYLSRRLDARRSEPTGTLRVATTIDLGWLLVGPAAARFVTAHPRARVEILADDAQKDLLDVGADLSVRLGVPKESSFVARKLGVFEEPIVATPTLTGALGAVTSPRDLAGAPWVRHSLVSSDKMSFFGPGGAQEDVTPSVLVESNSGVTVLSLLLNGAGVGVLPEYALREHLHHGRLVRLCPSWIWKSVTLFTLMPSRSTARPVVRAFLATLETQLAIDSARWGSISRAS